MSDLFKPFKELMHFVFEPKFTISIILINMVMFFVSVFFLSAKTLNALIIYPADFYSSKAYSLITSGFLHADIWHLLGNMLALFIFGRVVEKRIGSSKTALVYFGALIISGLFSSIINLLAGINIPGLGASGAIMGLVSAAILLDPFYLTYELIVPLPVMFAGWITIYADISGIINPTADGIGHFAHLGGFISIAIIMLLMGMEEKHRLKRGLIINAISLILGVIIYFMLF